MRISDLRRRGRLASPSDSRTLQLTSTRHRADWRGGLNTPIVLCTNAFTAHVRREMGCAATCSTTSAVPTFSAAHGLSLLARRFPFPTGGCERGGPTCRTPALPSKGGREGTPSSGYCYSPSTSAGGRRRGGRRRPAGSSPSLGSTACNWSPLIRPVPKSSIANASSSMTSRALCGNCA